MRSSSSSSSSSPYNAHHGQRQTMDAMDAMSTGQCLPSRPAGQPSATEPQRHCRPGRREPQRRGFKTSWATNNARPHPSGMPPAQRPQLSSGPGMRGGCAGARLFAHLQGDGTPPGPHPHHHGKWRRGSALRRPLRYLPPPWGERCNCNRRWCGWMAGRISRA